MIGPRNQCFFSGKAPPKGIDFFDFFDFFGLYYCVVCVSNALFFCVLLVFHMHRFDWSACMCLYCLRLVAPLAPRPFHSHTRQAQTIMPNSTPYKPSCASQRSERRNINVKRHTKGRHCKGVISPSQFRRSKIRILLKVAPAKRFDFPAKHEGIPQRSYPRNGLKMGHLKRRIPS